LPRVQIVSDVSPQDALSVQQRYFSRGNWTENRETYRAPDGQNFLDLSLKEEKRFGPALFNAAIVSEDGHRFNLSRHFNLSRIQVFSSGCYGRGFDHWAGDPWSPDSSKVALFQADVTNRAVNTTAAYFNVAEREWSEIISSPTMLSHHMWSPSGRNYLYRSLDTWFLVNNESLAVRPVGKSAWKYPKHCYFVSDDYILMLEGRCRLLTTESLDVVWDTPLPEDVGSGAYSLLDPANGRVFLGVNPSLAIPPLSELVTASKWYAFEVVA
jgi:hypothetical protein